MRLPEVKIFEGTASQHGSTFEVEITWLKCSLPTRVVTDALDPIKVN